MSDPGGAKFAGMSADAAAPMPAEGGILGLILDFDGLIADTESLEQDVWREIFSAHGAPWPADLWAAAVGTHAGAFDPCAHLQHLVGAPLDCAGIRRQQHDRFTRLASRLQPLPGIRELVEAAHGAGLRLGVASSSARSWVAPHLERMGLMPRFSTLACGDEVAAVKPDPALYRLALRRLGVSAHEAVAVEDSPNGIAAAKAAGLYCVAIPNAVTAPRMPAGADIVLPSAREIPLEAWLRATP